MLLIYTALGEKPLQKFIRYSVLVVPMIFVVAISDFGKKIIDYLPFVGSVDADNVTYRQNLFESSFQIILDNPFFGSSDYLLRMEDLRQGQGIIDLVNTFLIVGLNAGFVGLALYLLVFGLSIWGVFKRMKQEASNSVIHKLGQSLIAVMLGILVIIATVSPIYHVPLMLWSVTGLCLAYGRLGTAVR
jgi:O-antigen ligase